MCSFLTCTQLSFLTCVVPDYNESHLNMPDLNMKVLLDIENPSNQPRKDITGKSQLLVIGNVYYVAVDRSGEGTQACGHGPNFCCDCVIVRVRLSVIDL